MTDRAAPEELVRDHVRRSIAGGEECAFCADPWPCKPYRAAQYITRLEEENEELRAEVADARDRATFNARLADQRFRENERLRGIENAVRAWDEVHAAWFPTVNARPFDAEASARAAIARQNAEEALRTALSNSTKEGT